MGGCAGTIAAILARGHQARRQQRAGQDKLRQHERRLCVLGRRLRFAPIALGFIPQHCFEVFAVGQGDQGGIYLPSAHSSASCLRWCEAAGARVGAEGGFSPRCVFIAAPLRRIKPHSRPLGKLLTFCPVMSWTDL